MHGIITLFNVQTNIGMVQNNNRRVWEFKSDVWHSRNSLPARGMYAEFREGDNGKIASIKESNYKKLEKIYEIKEDMFWDSKTDSELEENAKDKFEDSINSGVDTFTYNTPITYYKTPQECFNTFYYDYIELCEANKEIVEEKRPYKFLDYAKTKRFISKARTHLVSVDPTVSDNMFASFDQKIKSLETSMSAIADELKTPLDKIYNELLIPLQVNYIRATKKTQKMEEELKIKEGNVAKLTNKLEREKSSNGANVASLETELAEAEKIVADLTMQKGVLEKNIEGFEKESYEEFSSKFNFGDKLKSLYINMKKIIDHTANEYDTKLWELGSKSKAIESTFYNNQTNSAYNSLSFVRAYTRNMDVNKVNPTDKALMIYLQKYDIVITTKAIFMSEDKDMDNKIDAFILQAEKDLILTRFTRASEALHTLKNPRSVFDVFFVDLNLKSMKAMETISMYLKNHKTKPEFVILYRAGQEATLKVLEEKLGVKHSIQIPIADNIELKEVTKKIIDAKREISS